MAQLGSQANDKLDKPKLRKTNLDRRLEYKRRKELRSKQEQRQGQASDVYRLLFGDV
jgi:hypothetical protein